MERKRIAGFAFLLATAAALPTLIDALHASGAAPPPPARPFASSATRPATPAAPPPTLPASRPAAVAAVPRGTVALPPTRGSQPAVDPNRVIIQVDGEMMTAAEFDAFISDLPPQDQAMARGPGRRDMAEYLIRMKLLAQEAERRHLQDQPKFRRQVAMIREQVLASALAADLQQSIDEAAIARFFAEHRGELERLAARHILVRTAGSPVPLREGAAELTEDQAKAKADEIFRRLNAGEDFATMARDNSDDRDTAGESGDLGSFIRGRMLPEFEQVAWALKEWEISPPVRTQRGWDIIQVTGRYDTPEKLGLQIRAILADQKMKALTDALRAGSKVTLDETYLGPAVPVDPAAPAPPAPSGR